MTPRALSFVRWASIGQAALAVYIIGASFLLVSSQGRDRESYSMYASHVTNDVFKVGMAELEMKDLAVSIANNAVKGIAKRATESIRVG